MSRPASECDASRDVRDRDDAGAALVELGRGDAADVAEALHDARASGELVAEPPGRLLGDHHDAGAGRLAPEDGAADRDRLARDDLRHGVAALHRVRVHHPRHRLLVGGHVGCGDVGVRADLADELRREAARELLELAQRQRVRVAADTALRAAVREPQERALPRHPRRESGALAERDLGVVAHAALRRAEQGRVLDAVAGEDLDRAVVAAERDADDDRALGVAEPLGDQVRDVRVGKRLLVLGARHAEQRACPTRGPAPPATHPARTRGGVYGRASFGRRGGPWGHPAPPPTFEPNGREFAGP